MPAEIGTKIVTARFGNPDAKTLPGYERAGGYAQLRKALAMRPEDITAEVKASNLRGRGGAGFATGVKWGFVPKDALSLIHISEPHETGRNLVCRLLLEKKNEPGRLARIERQASGRSAAPAGDR